MRFFKLFFLFRGEIRWVNTFFLVGGLFTVFLSFEVKYQLQSIDIKSNLERMDFKMNSSEIPFPYNDLDTLERLLFKPFMFVFAGGATVIVVFAFGAIATEMADPTYIIAFTFLLFSFTLFGGFLFLGLVKTQRAEELKMIALRTAFHDLVNTFNEVSEPYTDARVIYLEAIQYTLKCCGTGDVRSFKVWLRGQIHPISKLPLSCCPEFSLQQIVYLMKHVLSSDYLSIVRNRTFCSEDMRRRNNCPTDVLKIIQKAAVAPIWVGLISILAASYVILLLILCSLGRLTRSRNETRR